MILHAPGEPLVFTIPFTLLAPNFGRLIPATHHFSASLEYNFNCDCSGCATCGDNDDDTRDDTKDGYGGFLFLQGDSTEAIVANSTISACSAASSGGGIASYSGVKALTIEATDIFSCVAGAYGGGVFVDGR